MPYEPVTWANPWSTTKWVFLCVCFLCWCSNT